MRCYIYNYIWVLGAGGGVARPLARDHSLLFLPRARNNGTGAQTTQTMMQMYLKSVARSLSVFSASSGARYDLCGNQPLSQLRRGASEI